MSTFHPAASSLVNFNDININDLPSRPFCHVHVLPKRHSGFGVWSILPSFILGIKRMFPCSFGNKRTRLLTCVYGILSVSYSNKN